MSVVHHHYFVTLLPNLWSIKPLCFKPNWCYFSSQVSFILWYLGCFVCHTFHFAYSAIDSNQGYHFPLSSFLWKVIGCFNLDILIYKWKINVKKCITMSFSTLHKVLTPWFRKSHRLKGRIEMVGSKRTVWQSGRHWSHWPSGMLLNSMINSKASHGLQIAICRQCHKHIKSSFFANSPKVQ